MPLVIESPLADMDPHGFEAVFAQHVARRAPRSAVVDLAFADERQGDVGQLDQVAAGADAAVFGDEGDDVAVDEFGEQPDHVGVNARPCLEQRSEAGDHGRLDIEVGQRIAGAGRVAADDVVLQVGKVAIVNPPLGHGSEAGVDAVDDLPGGEVAQEFVALRHLVERQIRGVDFCVREEDLFNAVQF